MALSDYSAWRFCSSGGLEQLHGSRSDHRRPWPTTAYVCVLCQHYRCGATAHGESNLGRQQPRPAVPWHRTEPRERDGGRPVQSLGDGEREYAHRHERRETKRVQTGPTNDENQVRYGRDAYYPSNWQSLSCDLTNFAEQSGFGFDGNDGPVTPASNTPFYLGKFTHYNNQIYATADGGGSANAFTNVDLTITVPLTCNDGSTPTPASLSFTPNFILDETPTRRGHVSIRAPASCPDKVTVNQGSATATFTCPDGTTPSTSWASSHRRLLIRTAQVLILARSPRNSSPRKTRTTWPACGQRSLRRRLTYGRARRAAALSRGPLTTGSSPSTGTGFRHSSRS